MESNYAHVWCRAMECKHNETSINAIDKDGRYGWCVLTQINLNRDAKCDNIEEPNLDRGCDAQHEKAEAWSGAR